jgi:hypothetical protein
VRELLTLDADRHTKPARPFDTNKILMKTSILSTACALSLLSAFACKDSSSSQTSQSQPTPVPSKAWQFDTNDLPPSQSDLDAKAGKDIDEKNADAEFEKLKKEIEGGGGG